MLKAACVREDYETRIKAESATCASMGKLQGNHFVMFMKGMKNI